MQNDQRVHVHIAQECRGCRTNQYIVAGVQVEGGEADVLVLCRMRRGCAGVCSTVLHVQGAGVQG